MESIKEIKQRLECASIQDLTPLIAQYEMDERKGVINCVERARSRINAYEYELLRTKELSQYEDKYKEYPYICGIDEVGRGPFAGPVVAGAVILPKDCDILYLNDSKQLSKKMREELTVEIKAKAVSYALGIVQPGVIDEINILQATYRAMRQAIEKLSVKPDILLNDAVTIPDIDYKQVPIIKGDAKSISIAAASIIAKTARDEMMREYDSIYPGYDFAHNSGYGAPKHIAALKELGPTPIHRRTYISKYI